MSKRAELLPIAVTHEVRDSCLCLHVQRTARALARAFDEAFRPFGLTSGQFSLLMSLNRPDAPTMGQVAAVLAMDRTTLTANVKPLERRRLLKSSVDPNDKRSRRLRLTPAGKKLLAAAYPIWKRTHRALEKRLSGSGSAEELRGQLHRLL